MSARRRRIVFSERARIDLRSISLFGAATWGQERSAEYRSKLTDALLMLATYPELGQRTDLLAGVARVKLVGSHHIYYRSSDREIRIIRILHERMNPEGQEWT